MQLCSRSPRFCATPCRSTALDRRAAQFIFTVPPFTVTFPDAFTSTAPSLFTWSFFAYTFTVPPLFTEISFPSTVIFPSFLIVIVTSPQ